MFSLGCFFILVPVSAEFIVLAKYVFSFGFPSPLHHFSVPEGISRFEALIRDVAPPLINATVIPHLQSVVLEVCAHDCVRVRVGPC